MMDMDKGNQAYRPETPATSLSAQPIHYQALSSTSLNRRRFLVRSAAFAGVTVAASSFFGACGEAPAQAGPVTITVMENASTDDNGLSVKWLTDFQKSNPRIKITRMDYDKSRLTSMLAAGTPPDMVRTPGGIEVINLAARGVAKDLTPYYQQSKLLKEDDLLPVCDLYRWDGKTQGKGARYGMPHDWSQDSMYWVNQNLFEAAKVPALSLDVPTSFDNLLEIGKRLTQREGEKIKVYGLGHNWDWFAFILTQLAQDDASLYKNGDLSKLDFKQPAVKKIFQWAAKWAQAHIGDSPLDPGGDWNGALYMAGRYAILPWGYWFGGNILAGGKEGKELREKSLLIPTPQWGSKRVATCYGGTGFWIPATAKYPDEAWAFFEWFNGGPAAEFRAKSGWGISPLKHLFDAMPQTTEGEKQAYTVQKNELQYYQTLQFTPYVASDALGSMIDKHMLPVIRGQADIDQALSELDQEANTLAQQGKEQIEE